MTNCIERLPRVKKRTGLSRSSIYLRMRKNQFPRPISLGGRAVGWLSSEIDQWLEERIAATKAARAR